LRAGLVGTAAHGMRGPCCLGARGGRALGGCGRAAGAFRCLLNVELGSACAAVNQIDGGSYKDLETKEREGSSSRNTHKNKKL
jgi:hypothetical protein